VQDVASAYGKRPSPTDTQVVEEAIRNSVADPKDQARVITRWRTSSAAAHGLLWHHFGKAGTNAVDPQEEVALIAVGGHVDDLALDYFAAYWVAARAWNLLASRAGRAELRVDPAVLE
jgi:hypothetical protein